jgi:hypothetical protein
LTSYKLFSLDEAVAFVGAHEIFHFLRHSRQVGGRNGENEADQFAKVHLEEFRRARPGARAGQLTFTNTAQSVACGRRDGA